MEMVKILDSKFEIPYKLHYNGETIYSFLINDLSTFTWGDQFMQQAFLFDNIELASFLLTKNCNFNNVTVYANVGQDWTPFLDFIIENGFDLSRNISDAIGPPIVITIKSRNLKRVKTMISKGIELNSEIISKYDCVSMACAKGKCNLFKFLMSFNPIMNNVPYCINECVRYFNYLHHSKLGGKSFLYMIDKILETQNYDLNENAVNEDIIHSILIATKSCLIQILELFDKYGYNFTNCPLNFSNMETLDHMKIYHFLENHGCLFNNAFAGFKNCPCNSAIESLFSINLFKQKMHHDVIQFVLNYSKCEDILRVNNSNGNITDNLMRMKEFSLLLNVFQKANRVILPLNKDKKEFFNSVKKSKDQSLIEFVFNCHILK